MCNVVFWFTILRTENRSICAIVWWCGSHYKNGAVTLMPPSSPLSSLLERGQYLISRTILLLDVNSIPRLSIFCSSDKSWVSILIRPRASRSTWKPRQGVSRSSTIPPLVWSTMLSSTITTLLEKKHTMDIWRFHFKQLPIGRTACLCYVSLFAIYCYVLLMSLQHFLWRFLSEPVTDLLGRSDSNVAICLYSIWMYESRAWVFWCLVARGRRLAACVLLVCS